MGKSIFIASSVSLMLAALVSVYLWYDFSKGCEDYLKLAGDAPNVERADGFLENALEYIEENNMTSGNSAILFTKPSNDVGIWYNQIKGAKSTTENILKRKTADPDSVTQLEQDNALMKIREVVLDNASTGTSVTSPQWIEWYPNQRLMMFWWIMSAIFIIGVIVVNTN